MHRRLAAALVCCLTLLAACGDDDDAVDTTSSTTEADDAGDGGSDEADEGAGDDESTTTTDAGAEDPPDEVGGEDEGLGDPLVFVTNVSGDQEVPGPGDPAASGRAEIESDVDGRLCFDMVVRDLDADVAAAHVHEAPAGQSGGVVIDIGTPTATDGDIDTWSDVCVEVAGEVIERMNADPSAFYVNVHTSSYPDGAVRGQLEQATIFDLELS